MIDLFSLLQVGRRLHYLRRYDIRPLQGMQTKLFKHLQQGNVGSAHLANALRSPLARMADVSAFTSDPSSVLFANCMVLCLLLLSKTQHGVCTHDSTLVAVYLCGISFDAAIESRVDSAKPRSFSLWIGGVAHTRLCALAIRLCLPA